MQYLCQMNSEVSETWSDHLGVSHMEFSLVSLVSLVGLVGLVGLVSSVSLVP